MIGEAELRALAAGRWTAPLLALLHEEKGARFARLLAALGLPRDSLARTLAQAQEAGWIARNPGHGHPLRPDYLLTAKGEELGAVASRVMAARRRLGLASDSLPRWSLPIVARLEPGWARFGTLRDALAPVTPRALSLNLQQMIAGDIVLRRVEPDFPPTPLYGLAPAGRALAESLAV
ncbi:MAG TPA: winged helix-turn-helix transcriptional regulator [Allosphingosinicella sp.]|nr:winged helix-turn-helix transcriptional regulator [Allosphingosinicella sp.]